MIEISSTEADHHFRKYFEIAQYEPVTIMRGDKPSLVMISAVEYAHLKRRDKQVFTTADMPESLARLIIEGEMHPRHNALNDVSVPEGFGRDDAPTS